MAVVLWFVLGGACGSVPFGVLVARAYGVDLRRVGSGNIGAANVSRSVGKRLGALVLFCDASKGAVPVAFAGVFADAGGLESARLVVLGVAFAAVLGHCFSPWLGFRGGKGVATSLGVLLPVDPVLVGVAVLVFAAVFVKQRVVSAGSVAAAVTLPIAAFALGRERHEKIFLALLGALILVAHRDNLKRLKGGVEARFE